jgi:hypothetical protein
MASTTPPLPDDLRAAILGDLKPVKPLPPPWKRLALVAPIIIGVLFMPFLYNQVRETGDLGVLLSWVPVAVQVLLALGLLVIALREGVPGWRVSSMLIFAMVLAAYSLQILVNLLMFMQTPVSAGPSGVLETWASCFRVESLIGIPILVLVAWLVSRALPCRPLLAGFLAGTGAGIAAEASWRMICPNSEPGHVLLGHTGGILILGLTGFLLGYVWSVYHRAAADSRAA